MPKDALDEKEREGERNTWDIKGSGRCNSNYTDTKILTVQSIGRLSDLI